MGIKDAFKKLDSAIKKSIDKTKIENERKEELRILKEKYLSNLSHKELVQIYKWAFGEE